MKRQSCTFCIAAVAWLAASPLFAAQWIINTSSSAPEKTFDGAADWFEATNWVDEVIGSGTNATAAFWTSGGNWDSSGLRYVKLDRDLTIAKIVRWWNNTRVQSAIDENRRVVLGGDHTITLAGTNMQVYLAGLRVYGNIDIVASSSNPLFRQVEICGPVSNTSGSRILFDASKGVDALSRFRRDLWADGTSEGITNFAPTKVRFDGQCNLGFYAPEGSDGVSGVWKLEEGSPLVRRVGDAHALSAGTVVTGEGVPTGAYVKRIYSKALFELSEPATASTGDDGTTLEFAAFHPKAYQRIDPYTTVSHSSTYYDGFWPMKYSAEDEMTVEIFDLTTDNGTYHLYVDCESGFVPGRLILHNTSKFTRNLWLGTCEVEFAATTNNTTAGYPKTVRMRNGADGQPDVARVIIPEGVDASFGLLSNIPGKFIKAGAGSLAAPVTSNADFAAAEAGRLVVEEGSLVLTCASGDPIHVQTLAITNGATFTIPACGFEADVVFAEPGATVNGTGFFFTSETNDVSGITFGDGVTLVKSPAVEKIVAPESVYWETNVTAEVVGVPALWFDASQTNAFELADGTTYPYALGHRITRWNDVRGSEYGYASSDGSATPQYWQTNLPGRAFSVRILPSSTTVVGNRNLMKWNRTVSGIRSVFKVMSTFGGGSVLLGGCNRTRLLPSGNSRVKAYHKPIFGKVPAAYTNGLAFYVNGDRRDWRKGYPFGGPVDSGTAQQNRFLNNTSVAGLAANNLVPVLSEMHFPDATTSASNFGYNEKEDNGLDAICECVVYTNVLTEAERLSVRKYLMKKWCDASLNYVPDSIETSSPIDVGEDVAYRVDAGNAVVYSEMTGEGEFAKYGEGQVAITKVLSNSLHVAGGTLSLRSQPLPTASNLPGDPYLHLDANASGSLVVEDGKVVSWADVRGEGHPVATALNAGKGPTFVENALSDMPTVDFGAHTYGTIATYGAKCPTLVYDAVSNAHTVIQVLDTSQGGGALLGWHVQGQASIPLVVNSKSTNTQAYGLYRNNRYNGGDWTKPMVSTGSYSAAWYDLRTTDQPGGGRVRLNGEDVDGGATGFTGGYDLVSVVAYKPIRAGAIAQLGIDSSNFTFGGQKVCELLIYTNVLSRAEVKAVEAYLSKKWFNRTPPEYEQAGAKDVAVDDGAMLEVWGGAPLKAESLRAAGSVSGAVEIADGGVVEVSVAGDGTIPSLDVSGGLSLDGDVTIRLLNAPAKIEPGRYVLCPATAVPGATLTVEAEGCGNYMRAFVTGDFLSLEVFRKGLLILVD